MILASVSVLCSILCAKLWSMPSVLMGSILFYYGSFVYLMVLLKRERPKFKFSYIYRRTILLIFIPFLFFFLQNTVLNCFSETWIEWIITAFIVAVIAVIILGLYSFLFERHDLKKTINYLQTMIRK